MTRYRPQQPDEARRDEVVELAEENLVVEKIQTVTGDVRVAVTTDIDEETVRETLQSGVVEVTRVPKSETVASIPGIRVEGDVTILPVVEEYLFVERRLRLTEEIHVRRRCVEEVVELPVKLKKQRAAIERTKPEER